MRVLLAYPHFPADTFWSFEGPLAVAGRRSTMPPLGLLTLAGMLPPERFELALADENVRPIEDGEIANADAVFVSAMVAQLESTQALLDRCRTLSVPVVVGGPLVSGCYRELVERDWRPTAWFVGEAERLFPQLVEDLERGDLRAVYAHVQDEERAASVRECLTGRARILIEELPSLEAAPTPRFDLVDLRRYHSMAVQASRGCPIGCEFCDIWKHFGLKSRRQVATRLLAQFDYLFALGWRGRVFVVDDNFIGNVGAARDLLPELAAWQVSTKPFRIPDAYEAALPSTRLRRMRRRHRRTARRPYPFALSTEADVRIGDSAPKMSGIRTDMVRAGFNSLFLGIETPSAAALQEAGKKVNIGKEESAAASLLERVHTIQRAGMEVMSGFILGFDNDPADIDAAMIEFIEQAGIPMAMVGLLGVLPGTALLERLEREGRYRGHLVGTQTHSFELNFVPLGRSEAVVQQQYARVLEALYGGGMEPYYRRCERMMDTLPAPPSTGDGMGLRELLAFARSLLHVRPRRAYWRFLGRVLRRKPAFFGLAVVLALQGEHFHQLTVRRVREFRSRSRRTRSDASSPSRVLTPATRS